MQSYSFFYPAMLRLSFIIIGANDSALRIVMYGLFGKYAKVILHGSIKKFILKGF
jgi:hypothetical protein